MLFSWSREVRRCRGAHLSGIDNPGSPAELGPVVLLVCVAASCKAAAVCA